MACTILICFCDFRRWTLGCARPHVLSISSSFPLSHLPLSISGAETPSRQLHNELRADSQRLYTYIFFFVFLKMLHSAVRVHLPSYIPISPSLFLPLCSRYLFFYPPPGFSLYPLPRRRLGSKSRHTLPHVSKRETEQ